MILQVLPFELSMRASLFVDGFEKCDSHPAWGSHFQHEFSGGELLRCRNEKISQENKAKTHSEWYRSMCWLCVRANKRNIATAMWPQHVVRSHKPSNDISYFLNQGLAEVTVPTCRVYRGCIGVMYRAVWVGVGKH